MNPLATGRQEFCGKQAIELLYWGPEMAKATLQAGARARIYMFS